MLVWLVTAVAGLAQEAPGQASVGQGFSGLARLDVTQSRVVATEAGGVEITLYLSQPVPWRVFTLDAPRRLVLDFREVDWRGAEAAEMAVGLPAESLRFGALRPGWSRMILDLAGPLAVAEAGMAVGATDGTATLRVVLEPVHEAQFSARAGAPPAEPGWADAERPGPQDPLGPPPERDDGVLVVAIDPGHGGIDPGAAREGAVEAELMLALGLELAEAVNRSGTMRAVLTRQADVFVPLSERMTIARAAGAEVLLSLHADALEENEAARGASVYTLSREALDTASTRMAERHERGDLLAGLDLSGQDDTVATVLMDLARQETGPAALRLADALVAAMAQAGAEMNSRPRREGPLAVLNAADFPSVLIEAGFLSSRADRERLSTPEGRAPVVAGILAGLETWAAEEAVRRDLLRQ
jgi:N-acetylmuramoyl-L-alanine amidase